MSNKISQILSHYTTPSFSNNQKAKLLHFSSLLFFILGLFSYQIILQALPLSGLKILGYAANIPTSEVVRITNEKRAQNGLEQLTINSQLSAAAYAKGQDMLAKNYWAHNAPDGTQPWKFFLEAGYKYKFAGENLARDFSNASSAVDAWMASPSHRDNMLSAKYSEIGVAVVEGDLDGVDTTIIVQLFGTKYQDASLAEAPPSEKIAADIQADSQTNEVKLVPSPMPTTAPAPTIAQEMVYITSADQGSFTQEQTSSAHQQVLISPFYATKGVSVITVLMLLGVLIIDGIITHQNKTVRIAGRTFAHLAFLGMILAMALLAKAGSII